MQGHISGGWSNEPLHIIAVTRNDRASPPATMSASQDNHAKPCGFLRLPYELRLWIYEMLSTSHLNRSIGIDSIDGPWNPRCSTRLKGNICVSATGCLCGSIFHTDASLMDELKHINDPTIPSEPLRSSSYSARTLGRNPAGTSSARKVRQPICGSTISTAILRTCRLVYHEAHCLHYELNTFRFNELEDLALFARKISPENAEGLQSISLVFTGPAPGQQLSPLDAALIRQRLSHLKKLLIFLHYPSGWYRSSEEIEDVLLKLFRGVGRKSVVRIVHAGSQKRASRMATMSEEGKIRLCAWERILEETLMV